MKFTLRNLRIQTHTIYTQWGVMHFQEVMWVSSEKKKCQGYTSQIEKQLISRTENKP